MFVLPMYIKVVNIVYSIDISIIEALKGKNTKISIFQTNIIMLCIILNIKLIFKLT